MVCLWSIVCSLFNLIYWSHKIFMMTSMKPFIAWIYLWSIFILKGFKFSFTILKKQTILLITKAYIFSSFSRFKLTCKVRAVTYYVQCPDTATSILALYLYTSHASRCHWSYHATGWTMQACKCQMRLYLAKWVPITVHWLF